MIVAITEPHYWAYNFWRQNWGKGIIPPWRKREARRRFAYFVPRCIYAFSPIDFLNRRCSALRPPHLTLRATFVALHILGAVKPQALLNEQALQSAKRCDLMDLEGRAASPANHRTRSLWPIGDGDAAVTACNTASLCKGATPLREVRTLDHCYLHCCPARVKTKNGGIRTVPGPAPDTPITGGPMRALDGLSPGIKRQDRAAWCSSWPPV